MQGAKAGKSKVKVLMVVAIVIVAAIAGGSYYFLTSIAKPQFTIAVSSTFVHVIPGSGALVIINVTRLPSFTQDVSVTITNAPSWVNYQSITVPSQASIGNLTIVASQAAPKGSIPLVITASAPSVTSQTATVSMKVVSSYNMTSSGGTAQLFDTTKILDNTTIQTLASYSSVTGTVTFSQSTPQLQTIEVGDVIVLQPGFSSNVPGGFLRMVLSLQNSGGQVQLATQQARLQDMALSIVTVGHPPAGNSTTTTGSYGGYSVNSASPTGYYSEFRVPCQDSHVGKSYTLWQAEVPPGGINENIAQSGSGSAQLTGSFANAQLCLYGGLAYEWDLSHPIPTIHYAEVDLTGLAGSNLSLDATAGSTIQWNKNLYDFFKGTIVIIPGVLWIDLGAYLEGIAFGHIGPHDIHLGMIYQIGFIEGPEYCDSDFCGPYGPNGWTWDGGTYSAGSCSLCALEYNPQTVVNLAGTTLTIGVGPHGHADVDSGLVSIDIGAHVDATFTAQIPHNPTWWIDGGLDFTLSLGAFWGLASWNPSPLTCCKWNIMNGPNYPPETPALTIPSSADTIDLSTGFTNPNPFGPWVATTTELEGEGVTCHWMTELGELGTSTAQASSNGGLSCNGPAGGLPNSWITEMASKGISQLTVTVVAEDSSGEKSDPSNPVTVQVKLPPGATVEIVNPTTGETGQPPNTLFVGNTYVFQADAFIAEGAYHQALPCDHITWEVPNAALVIVLGHGCTLHYTPKGPGTVSIEASITYNGAVSYSKVIRYTITSAPATYTAPPTVKITAINGGAPYQQQPISVNNPVSLSGQVDDSSEIITGNEIYWAAYWEMTNGQNSALVPIQFNPGTYKVTVIHAIGGNGGSTYVTGTWDLSKWCTSAGIPSGTVHVELSAKDSKGRTSQTDITPGLDLSCQLTHSLPLLPGAALVSLLTLLFAITADCKKTIVEMKPWLRSLGKAFIPV